jgi:hypothetical protein
MPDLNHSTPNGFAPFRLYAVHVKDKFSRFFTVPYFEIGIVKTGWRGCNVEVAPTSDIRDISTNAQEVYNNLCARYGVESVQRYHPGPERLEEDMQRCAAETRAWLEKCREAELFEETKRINAEKASRILSEKMRAEAETQDIIAAAAREAQIKSIHAAARAQEMGLEISNKKGGRIPAPAHAEGVIS